jgi:hypothetical protein
MRLFRSCTRFSHTSVCVPLHQWRSSHNSIDSAEYEEDDTRPGRDVPHVLSTAVLVLAMHAQLAKCVECGHLFQTVTACRWVHVWLALDHTTRCPTLRVQLEEGEGGGEHEVKAVLFRELHLFLPLVDGSASVVVHTGR